MTRTNRSYLLILLFFCAGILSETSRAADTPVKEEIAKVDSLNQLAFAQKRTNVALALNYLFNAENIASTIKYQKGLGVNYLYQAGIFHQIGFDKRALSTYYKALQIFKNLNDTYQIAFTSQQIALSLQSDGKIDEAIQLYNQSLQVFISLKREEDIINVKNSLGLVEMTLQHPEKAEAYFTQALNESAAISYVYGEKKALYNLGLLQEKKKNFKQAEGFYIKSLSKDEALKDKYGAALNELQLSSLNSKQNMPDASISMAREAYQNAAAVSAYNLMKDAVTSMIAVYRQKGDDNKAMQWQDSLVKILKTQIENEKVYALNFIDVIKSQDIQKINAENEVKSAKRVQSEQLLIITVGTFILIIVAVLAVLALVNYQRQRFFGKELKQKNEIIEKNSASLDQLNKEISNQNILLEADNKTKNKLLSIISHDLRTPLVNTKGVLNLVNQGMVPQEESDRLLQLLETQYIGTTSLLDNLLFWIKGQMNGQEDDKVKVSLYHLMKALEDEQRLPLMKKKIELINHIDKGISVIVEKEMIRIVCRNLISNAIKFTNEGGFVELSSRIAGNTLFLTVRDSGIGMTQEAIEKVNAKQYYNTTGTSFEKGSGFGLMLCRDLITKNGGELIIESEPGAGSSFTITIPYTAPVSPAKSE